MLKGHRHLAALEHARRPHVALQRADLVLIDEHQEIAGMGEVDLRREECRRGDANTALFRKPGQR